MSGRFGFYRRRRVLPFLAVYCLVCINGATLVPLASPAPIADAAAGRPGDSWHQARYERGRDHAAPETVVASAVPPIVKNLRRPAPDRHGKVASGWHAHRPLDVRASRTDCSRQMLAANAADVTRLCRLLL